MADAEDLKSSGDFSSCGFDSHPGHQFVAGPLRFPSIIWLWISLHLRVEAPTATRLDCHRYFFVPWGCDGAHCRNQDSTCKKKQFVCLEIIRRRGSRRRHR
jgi:hypothetical protein